MASPRDGADELLQQRVRRRSPRLEEVDVLMSLRGICPDVVQLLDVYETNQEVQLVLEYCQGGDLFDCIKRRRQKQLDKGLPLHGLFTEAEAASLTKTMLSLLDVLHARNIVHRDIKPENILLVNEDEGNGQQLQVKLTDFGLARMLDGGEDQHGPTSEDPVLKRSRAYSRVGSDYYAAPEVYMGLGYDTPVDIYSLGVTLYVLLVGAPPSTSTFSFDADSDLSDESSVGTASEGSARTYQSSRTKLFPPETNISPSAQELITSMIHPDAGKRITASAALKHEWILSHSAGQEDIEMATTDVKSKLSISLPRNTSVAATANTDTFLRVLPIEGSLFEIAPPPTNSPTAKASSNSAVTLTLADVCSKLVPIANGRVHPHKKKRSRHRSELSRGEIKFSPSKKHTRNISDLSGEELTKLNITTTPTKKVRVESRKSSPNSLFANHLRVTA